MKLSTVNAAACVASIASFAHANPACQNTLAAYNPNLRTMCLNATWFVLPIDKASVQSVVPYPLLTPPFPDTTLFPKGFPSNAHPVLVSSGYNNDIRMASLQIPALKSASIYVPYTDRLGNGMTAFNYPLSNYIGGVDGGASQTDISFLQAIVPCKSSPYLSLSEIARIANPKPPSSPSARRLRRRHQHIHRLHHPKQRRLRPPNLEPQRIQHRSQAIILPNPVSGPAIGPEVFDLDFITATSPLYTEHTFHAPINQPEILNNGLCQRNVYYFNQTFSDAVLRSGNATLYPPLAGAAPAALAGVYTKQGGYSASGENVGYNAESCVSAAANADPGASQ